METYDVIILSATLLMGFLLGIVVNLSTDTNLNSFYLEGYRNATKDCLDSLKKMKDSLEEEKKRNDQMRL